MNKYQKALDELCGYAKEIEIDYDYDDNLVFDYVNLNEAELSRLRNPLQELVDRATRKKVEKDECFHDSCPNCGWIVYDEYAGQQRYVVFCENCGQALDWSVKDE